MLTKSQLQEKNKYLARKLTAEWLKNAYIRKHHELEMADLVESETRKVEQLTRSLQQLHQEFESLQDEVEDLRDEKSRLIKEASSGSAGSVQQLKEHIRNLEGLLNRDNEKCRPLEIEIKRLQKENDRLKTSASSNQKADAEKDELYIEIEELQDANTQLEQTIKDLEGDISAANQRLFDVEETSKTRELALTKAQNLIKKLNDECERTVKDLITVEQNNEVLKRTNRELEKDILASKKEFNEVGQNQKIEERLRKENTKLKDQLAEFQQIRNSDTENLEGKLQQITIEKKNLEASLDELEEKLQQIESECVQVEVSEKAQFERAKKLEAELEEKERIIEGIKADIQAIADQKDEEIEHIKHQAENAIRHLRNFQSEKSASTHYASASSNSPNASPMKKGQMKVTSSTPGKPGKPGKPTLAKKTIPANQPATTQASLQNLLMQLDEAAAKEERMNKIVKNLIEREAKFLDQHLDAMKKIEEDLRPEVERWTMRCQELEQRMEQGTVNHIKITKSLNDAIKTIRIKDKQMADQRSLALNKQKELLALIDFLEVELLNRTATLTDDVFPSTQKLISGTLSGSHEKMQQLVNRSKILENEFSQVDEKMTNLDRRNQVLEEENKELKFAMFTHGNDIQSIEQAMDHKFDLDNPDISDQARSIISNIERNFANLSSYEQYVNDNMTLRDELNVTLDQLQQVKTDLNKSNNEKDTLFLEINKLTENLENAKSQYAQDLNNLRENYSEGVQKQIQEMKNDSDRLRQQLKQTEDDLERQKSENFTMSEDLAKQQSENSNLSAELVSKEEELEQSKTQWMKEIDRANQDFESKARNLQEQFNAVSDKLEAYRDERNSLSQEIIAVRSELTAKNDEIERSKVQFIKEMERANETRNQLAAKNEELDHSKAQFLKEMERANETRNQLMATNEEMDRKKAQFMEEMERVKNETRSQLAAKSEEMERNKAQFMMEMEKANNETRNQLTAKSEELDRSKAQFLKELERANNETRSQLVAKNEELNRSKAQFMKDIERANRETQDFETKSMRLSEQYIQANEQLQAFRDERNQLSQEIIESKNQLSAKNEELDRSKAHFEEELERATQEYESKTRNLEEQYRNVSENILIYQTERDALSSEIMESRKQLQAKNQELASSKADFTREMARASQDFESKTLNLKEQYNDVTAKLEEFREERDELSRDIIDARNQIDAKKAESQKAEQEITADLQKMLRLETDMTYLTAERNDLQQTVNLLESRLRKVENTNMAQTAQVSEQHKQSSDLNTRLEQLLKQKEEYIADIEAQLEEARSNFLNTQRSNTDDEYYKVQSLKTKLDRKAQSYKNRVREFETILRYLETKIMNSSPSEISSMFVQVQEITARNPSLENWIRTLDSRIDIAFEGMKGPASRELEAYTEILHILRQAIGPGEIDLLINALTQEGEIEFISKRIVEYTRKALESAGTSDGLPMIQPQDLDALLHAIQYLQKLEYSLKDRYQSMEQVSHKASELLENMHSYYSPEYAKEMTQKIVTMFNRFFSQFLTAFYGDIEVFESVMHQLGALVPGSQAASPLGRASPLVGHMDSLNDILQL